MRTIRAILVSSALLTVGFTGAAQADPVLDAAARQLQAGSAEAAYQTLAALESQRAGEPAFDLLLGRAAIASGRPGLALFALERAVAMEPDNAAARVEYARAYAAAGLNEAARAELVEARKANPDDQTSSAIRSLDEELNVVNISVNRGLRANLDLFGGYDTNINGATDERIVPGITVPLDDRFREQDDFFTGFGGAVDYQAASFGKWDILAGARARHHANLTSRFDFTTFGAYVGFSTARGANEFSGTIGFDRFIRDGNGLRRDLDARVRWRHALDERSVVSFYGEASDLEHDDQSRRDGKRYVGGARYVRRLQAAWNPVVFAGAYGGTVDTDSSGNPQLDYKLYGLSLGAQGKVNDWMTVFGVASYEGRDYDGPVATSNGADREDDAYSVAAGANVVPTQGWRITPTISYRNNDSNAALSDHDRALFSIRLRREFN